MTPADHANTVRRALDGGWHPVREDGTRVETQRHRDAHAALDALLAQAETAEGRVEMLYRLNQNQIGLVRAAEAERDTAVRERDQARDALRFYADPATWDEDGRAWTPPTAVPGMERDEDRGAIARAALSAREEVWDEEAFVAEMHRRAAREEAWTHEDRMVLGEGGC